MHNQEEIIHHAKNTAPNPDTITTHRKQLGRNNALGCHDFFFLDLQVNDEQKKQFR